MRPALPFVLIALTCLGGCGTGGNRSSDAAITNQAHTLQQNADDALNAQVNAIVASENANAPDNTANNSTNAASANSM